MANELADRCNTIEECYEFMLAYAAQGLPGTAAGGKTGQARDYLRRGVNALSGLGEAYTAAIGQQGLASAGQHQTFLAVMERDAADSLAAIELVLAQPVISSQLIDNLNASIHLRALLTDLFLVDEILKLQRISPDAAAVTLGAGVETSSPPDLPNEK
jgi:hypothetical protein